MGQMLVRNLDDAVVESLKRKALERGTSLEQVAREALTEAAQKDERAAWAARANSLRAQTRPDPGFDTVAAIRAARDGDPLTRLREDWEATRAAPAVRAKGP